MFTSAKGLERDMGVNITIAKFFVDRKPPENNSFWKGKLLYVTFGNGYRSIPVYYDILHRIGIPVEVLLDEKHVQLMEQLMHFAILQERNEISHAEELSSIRGLLDGRVKNPPYFDMLNQYHDQDTLMNLGMFGLNYPSLNRADMFLYILCDLPLDDKQWELALRYWYAMHPIYLMLDDLRDYVKDKEDGDHNVVVESGDGMEGFERVIDMLQEKRKVLAEINPALADFLVEDKEELRKYIPINN